MPKIVDSIVLGVIIFIRNSSDDIERKEDDEQVFVPLIATDLSFNLNYRSQ